ncbi:MAG: peroxiredoxin [Chitinophagales bacterium]|nr:peroxiredoxin [Hyphomicrobiales bacterium]
MRSLQNVVTEYHQKFGNLPTRLQFRGQAQTEAIFKGLETALESGVAFNASEVNNLGRWPTDARHKTNVGSKLPDVTFTIMTVNGPVEQTTTEIFSGKKVVLVGIIGAFAPMSDVQDYLGDYDAYRERGVDFMACTSVNDIFVLHECAKAHEANARMLFLADGNAALAQALGTAFKHPSLAFGVRSKRYCMLVDNGVIRFFFAEDGVEKLEHTRSAQLLAHMSEFPGHPSKRASTEPPQVIFLGSA